MVVSRSQPEWIAFWPLQIGGWAVYSLSITIAYIPEPHERAEILASVAMIATAFLASFSLRYLCRYLWRSGIPLFYALGLCAVASSALGMVCVCVEHLSAMYLSGGPMTVNWGFAFAEGLRVGVILSGWSALYFGIKHYQMVGQQRARLLASEATARDAQLLALHYQLQPHFLFNTLNAISSLVISKQPELATEMIARLAGLLRNTLAFPHTHTVTLQEEIAVVEEYLTIERVRFGSRLRISFDINSEANGAQVPRFLLQPLIENAIRHSIAQSAQGGEIAVSAHLTDDRLRIDVANDVCSPARAVPGQSHGVGLANTRARLSQLYGTDGAELHLSKEYARFVVSLRLPLIMDPIASMPGAGP